ncbi:hypothetical protein NIM87_15450 [Devosia sp. XJ19-1]|uniref:DUF2314 domain-containing protein n=1 Tax=Devosia ureilytica TaxID=2952754 RepID=A0A9Q4ARL9_9HYPH|nr:hypothetical protein [Devosia ureilytica]MCP8884904.1 hypothetical protein [Devosia ureilytica]MCP8888585.1 hypothetical protein [Devosia ureilytica]
MRTRLLLLPLCALAGPALAEDIACEGAFAIDSSEARLIEMYGADNVRTEIVPGPEGTEMLATLVFPDSPKRKLMFVWWDEDKRRDPSFIELTAKMVAPGGLRIGLTVAEVEALNGEPFTLLGFGWDYGGAAGFQSGNLADLPGGCVVSLTFSPPDYPVGDDVDSIMGDVEVSSSNPLLAQVGARVESVAIGYPHPDFRD